MSSGQLPRCGSLQSGGIEPDSGKTLSTIITTSILQRSASLRQVSVAFLHCGIPAGSLRREPKQGATLNRS